MDCCKTMFSSSKNFLIFGFGVSGQSVFKFLIKQGHNVAVFDEAENEAPNKVLKIDYENTDIIIKSPSVKLDHPVLEKAREKQIPILSTFDVFRKYNPGVKLIGITGTNGKSTTAALTYHILKEAGISVTLGGNIGIPYFDLPKSEYCVLEMSSYELASSQYLDFEIGCVTNIEPDHISFHGTFENYVAAKHKLLEHSKTKIISCEDCLTTSRFIDSMNCILVSINDNENADYFINEGTLIDNDNAIIDMANLAELRGNHNRQNILFAYAICKKLGIPTKEIARGIESFKALPHRMNSVRKIENILFVNDSKATNPDSTAKALATFVGYKIFWLVGGRSKKIDPLRYVSKYLKNVHKIYLFGESENEFAEIFKKSAKTVCCKDLEIAVNTAFKEAQKETGPIVVLLSPMCASFDQFKNFEERGDKFVEIVLKLRKDEKQF